MIMKNIMILIAAGLLSIASAHAQERGGNRPNRNPEEMAKMQVERLTKQLSLDQKQQDSILKYTIIATQEQRKIMEEANSDREATGKKMRALREQNTTKLKSFLTDDQIKKYDEMIKNRQQRGNRESNNN